MITIRKSTSSDAPVLSDIWRDSALATHDFLSQNDFKEIEAMVREQYLPNAEVWVAEDAGKPVGFMGMTDSHIDSLFIAPNLRGKGVGKHMLAHAKSLFGDKLTVDVNEQNSQGVGFYLHMGFQQTGRSELDDQGKPYPILHLKLITV
ncbi:acetyltransferase [Ochrobactrum sp. SFR4]|uniref:acetyltransferase n=1 Tax=Ochrobactrum sp. SFR4 TaxID=2717368 RepID=UPI001C8B3665|nr:acetyltransferase [Ochrobactrum sp. SFR4]MBX8827379.1 acetyltransferase [Ochrobactrum sp. SFR4]